MSSVIESLKVELVTAIKKDQITLPTLPEVALQVRDAASDPDASVASLSDVLNTDAALSARVVKVANSPMLRGNHPIEDVKMAVGRLGLDYTANLATGLAMEQMFQATSDAVDQRMREVWTRSTEVAGICHALCKHYTSLKPDQATLAGLIHKIGVLPILTFAEESHTELLDDPVMLDMVINDLSPAIGSLILKTWDFPLDIVQVPKEHVNFARRVEKVDYSDLVMVSVLQSYIGSSHPYTQLDWTQISAFDRVGLEPEINAYEVEDLNAEMEAAMAMLQ
jgi:HD-like signal output (HDOD) protein